MKKIFILMFSVFLMNTNLVLAQRQEMTEKYTASYPDTYVGIPGTLKYSCIVAEDGSLIKDGPLSINCKLNKTNVNGTTVSGTYTLTTTYSNGMINGAMSSKYELVMTNKKGTETAVVTFKGNFKNGVPHGNFVINNNVDNINLNVNYNNGKLVGALSCNKIKGKLNDQSKPIGTWGNQQFQNGVLITETIKSSITGTKVTKPALVELAKKYVSGTITEEKLAEKGIMVLTGDYMVGYYPLPSHISDNILTYSCVDFSKLRGYDFTVGGKVEYTYLEETQMLTQDGVDNLVNCINEYIEKGFSTIELPVVNHKYTPAGSKYGCMFMEKPQGRTVIEFSYDIRNSDNPHKYIANYDKDAAHLAGISQKQLSNIHIAVEPTLINNAISMKDFMLYYYDNLSQDSDQSKHMVDYINDTISGESNLDKLRNKYEVLLSDYERVKKMIKSPYVSNDDYMLVDTVVVKSISNSFRLIKYINKESIKDFETLIDEKNREIREVEFKREVEYKEAIQRICNYLSKNPGIGFFSKAKISAEFINSYGLEPLTWKVEVYTLLKPFRKIVSCEVVSYDMNTGEVVLCITKRTEEKKNVVTDTKYQVPVEIRGGRLMAKSIDFSKATIVE
ncbi:MAG: hypothetical protein II981_02895 [Bacteroidales bacterium]|nr:hypothetical protein [Bacteroidales bacterium]